MEPFNLYTDQSTLFECSLAIQGIESSGASARLIADTDSINLVFYGTMDTAGSCSVTIPDVCGILDLGVTGAIRLEVIADGCLFVPWTSDFVVSQAVQVNVIAEPVQWVVQEVIPFEGSLELVDEPVTVDVDAVVERVEVEPVVNVLPERKVKLKKKPVISSEIAAAILKGLTQK